VAFIRHPDLTNIRVHMLVKSCLYLVRLFDCVYNFFVCILMSAASFSHRVVQLVIMSPYIGLREELSVRSIRVACKGILTPGFWFITMNNCSLYPNLN
jgi:hypothetical protein